MLNGIGKERTQVSLMPSNPLSQRIEEILSKVYECAVEYDDRTDWAKQEILRAVREILPKPHYCGPYNHCDCRSSILKHLGE